jgi:hypothetical protein
VLEQGALADAGLATQDQRTASTGPRSSGELVDPPDLTLPANECTATDE